MNPALDASSSVENVFPEHKLRCGPVRYDPGGGGINVARAIKRLGGNALALQCCGGATGGSIRTLLAAKGVSEQPIEISGGTRERLTVLESATGQQYRFVLPGPTLSEAEWQRALDAVRAVEPRPALIVTSGSLPPGVPEDFYGRLARLLREQGSRLILDTSGAAGVLLASSAGCERMRSPTVAVRSKVGEGDSMVAGIALSLAQGSFPSRRRAVRCRRRGCRRNERRDGTLPSRGRRAALRSKRMMSARQLGWRHGKPQRILGRCASD